LTLSRLFGVQIASRRAQRDDRQASEREASRTERKRTP
jgi:hypothetical protein